VFSGSEGCAIAISDPNSDAAIWFTNDFRPGVDDFNAGRVTRRNLIRPRSTAGIALRPEANLQDRHLAKIEAALRRQDNK
jgi:hypothetical protein